MNTGGRSFGGKLFRPRRVALASPLVIQLPSLCCEISQALPARARSGQATMWKSCAGLVSQNASIAASLAGCWATSCLPA